MFIIKKDDIVKKYNLDNILNELNCWCMNWDGNINAVYGNETTMLKKMQQLFWVVKTTVESQVDLSNAYKELYEFVIDYFNSLEVREILNNLINERFDELMINATYNKETETILLKRGIING